MYLSISFSLSLSHSLTYIVTHTHIHTHIHTHTHTHARVTMRRDHLLEDAFRFIMATKAEKLRRKRCNISWDREEG